MVQASRASRHHLLLHCLLLHGRLQLLILGQRRGLLRRLLVRWLRLHELRLSLHRLRGVWERLMLIRQRFLGCLLQRRLRRRCLRRRCLRGRCLRGRRLLVQRFLSRFMVLLLRPGSVPGWEQRLRR